MSCEEHKSNGLGYLGLFSSKCRVRNIKVMGFFLGFFMDFILEENAHGLALKVSQNHGNLENYKHGTVK